MQFHFVPLPRIGCGAIHDHRYIYALAEYLETTPETEPFNADEYDDPDDADFARQDDLRRGAADLLLVERAREWLLKE